MVSSGIYLSKCNNTQHYLLSTKHASPKKTEHKTLSCGEPQNKATLDIISLGWTSNHLEDHLAVQIATKCVKNVIAVIVYEKAYSSGASIVH